MTSQFPGVALVTGASSGIGAQTAILFAKLGCKRIVIADINEDGLAFTRVDMLNIAPDVEILSMHLDQQSEGSIRSMISCAVAKFGRIDYACNVAGICLPGTGAEVSIRDFEKQHQVNAAGGWICQRVELEQMVAQDPLKHADSEFQARGSIVNVASMAGLIGLPNLVGYCASKHAVVGFTKSDAMHYGQDLIRINAVCPGAIKTPMLGSFFGGPVEAFTQALALKREGYPQEVAECIVWLVSHKASYVTGTTLSVHGGMIGG